MKAFGILLLCFAVPMVLFAEEDLFGPIPAVTDEASVEQNEAWQEWVDAFAKAEEIEFFRPLRRGEPKGESRKLADPQQLKAIAAEVSGSLEASPVTECEDLFEVRIKGFQPRKSAMLWVSVLNAPGPEGLKGHLFLIGEKNDEEYPFSSISVGTKKGKSLPVLGKVLSEVCRAWNIKLPEEVPSQK